MSWKHLKSDYPNPLTYEEKVDVFYEQTLGWQLHIADLISNGGTTFGQINTGQPGDHVQSIRHSGFAVLHICFSYFELVGSLVCSHTKSTDKFKHGVRDVLPGLFTGSPGDDMLLKSMYKGARCGLYHSGRTGPRVGLGQPSDGSTIAFDTQHGVLIVNPHTLPVVLKVHLAGLKGRLLDPGNVSLRKRFQIQANRGFQ